MDQHDIYCQGCSVLMANGIRGWFVDKIFSCKQFMSIKEELLKVYPQIEYRTKEGKLVRNGKFGNNLYEAIDRHCQGRKAQYGEWQLMEKPILKFVVPKVAEIYRVKVCNILNLKKYYEDAGLIIHPFVVQASNKEFFVFCSECCRKLNELCPVCKEELKMYRVEYDKAN